MKRISDTNSYKMEDHKSKVKKNKKMNKVKRTTGDKRKQYMPITSITYFTLFNIKLYCFGMKKKVSSKIKVCFDFYHFISVY